MTLQELKTKISKYQYLEDTSVIDVALAGIISTRLKLGDPIWTVIIGASSGGKSQILRPLSLTDPKFLHRIDDLTENTFLSGMKLGKGAPDPSLLIRIGPKGMLVISDLTVLFSKNKESRSVILSQFRMLYDGEMIKYSGTSSQPIQWKGYLGVLAGSTPSIYHHFEEVADMGERFIYYRMKDYNAEKATRLAMSRGMFGKELDDHLSDLYKEYIQETVKNWNLKDDKVIKLSTEIEERILEVSLFAERIRTTITMDFHKKDIIRIPVPAMPMRVSLQLTSLAKGLYVMRKGVLGAEDMRIIDWCAYSLANEEKRAVLRILGGVKHGIGVSTQRIADVLGLSTGVTRNILQNLSAVGVLIREGIGESLHWRIGSVKEWQLVRSIEGIMVDTAFSARELTAEESEEAEAVADETLAKW